MPQKKLSLTNDRQCRLDQRKILLAADAEQGQRESTLYAGKTAH